MRPLGESADRLDAARCLGTAVLFQVTCFV